MAKKYFGTDGVRGLVGKSPMTADFVMKLGWAAGRVLAREGSSEVLIGKDTRVSGYLFESALEAGLAAAGVSSRMLGPMPTPGVAYLTKTFRASAGIVISASHNPYDDNGVKFFSAEGKKLPDELERAIEAEIDKPMETVPSAKLGRAYRINDAAGRYIEFCKSTFPSGIRLDNLRLIVDTANGAAYDIAPRVFQELGADVTAIANKPNGLNINERCGATSPDNLRAHVLLERADVGIALDGDGDRLIMVDSRGEIVDGDAILYILAQARLGQGVDEQHGVVGTLMTNLGLEHALRDLNIPFARANVGDRYVMEQLAERDWLIGGESSGHILCLDRTTTGDAIVAALQVLAYLKEQGKSLSELTASLKRYPQKLINVRVAERKPIDAIPAIQKAVQAAEEELGDTGRVLLRPSGTEPVVRVMVEGVDGLQVERLCTQIAGVVESALQ